MWSKLYSLFTILHPSVGQRFGFGHGFCIWSWFQMPHGFQCTWNVKHFSPPFFLFIIWDLVEEDVAPFTLLSTKLVLFAVTENYARMVVNSKTSRVHSNITILARMKSDLGVTRQNFLLSKSIKQQIKLGPVYIPWIETNI